MCIKNLERPGLVLVLWRWLIWKAEFPSSPLLSFPPTFLLVLFFSFFLYTVHPPLICPLRVDGTNSMLTGITSLGCGEEENIIQCKQPNFNRAWLCEQVNSVTAQLWDHMAVEQHWLWGGRGALLCFSPLCISLFLCALLCSGPARYLPCFIFNVSASAQEMQFPAKRELACTLWARGELA